MLRLLLIFLLFAFANAVSAQYHKLKRYTIADGMPNTEVMNMMIDSSGELWLTFSGGIVARFDGIEFHAYSHAQLGYGNYQHTFMEDEHGVWIYDLLSSISLYTKDSLFQPQGPVPMQDLFWIPDHGVLAFGTDLVIYDYDPNKKSWVALSERGLDLPRDSNYTYKLMYSTWTDHPIVVSVSRNKEPWSVYMVTDLLRGKTVLHNAPSFSEFRFHSEFSSFPLKFNLGAAMAIISNGRVKTVRNVDGQPLKVRKPMFFKEQLYFQATTDDEQLKPIYRVDKDGLARPILVLKDFVEHLVIDRAGYYWFSSHSGLLRVDPSEFTIFQDNPEMVKNLHAIGEDDQGNLWFGGWNDGLSYFDGTAVHKLEGEGGQLTILPGSAQSDDGEALMFENTYGLIGLKNGSWRSLGLIDTTTGKPIRGYYFHKTVEGDLALGSNNLELVVLKRPVRPPYQYHIIGKDNGVHLGNVISIEQDKNGRFWCGRLSQGIALYDPQLDKGFTWLINEYAGSLGAMSMERDHLGNLWIGAADGVYLLEAPDNVELGDTTLFQKMVPVLPKIIGGTIVPALHMHNRQMMISTFQGHGMLDLESFYRDPERAKLAFTNTSDPERGGAGEQNAIYIDSRNRVWIGKDRGVVCIDPALVPVDTFTTTLAPPIVVAGDSTIRGISGELSWHLPVNKRHVTMQLSTNFQGFLEREGQYYFRIGRDKEVLSREDFQATGQELVFDYLSPGDYTVEVQFRKNNQVRAQATYRLMVPYARGENPLFWIVGFSMFFILAAAAYYFWRAAYDARRSAALYHKEMQAKVRQMQVRALTTSLNPHFINNSLNWLQYKVKEDKEAVLMISRLSENIRTIFLHSRNGIPYHSLGEELRLVENYLRIQRLRYGKDLEFNLPDLARSSSVRLINVPIMQVQIHVENAIEHGIRNRNSPGWLNLEVSEEDDMIRILVEDNGIGREKARRIKSDSTGQGTRILGELRDVFNAYNAKKIKIKYEDLPFVDPVNGDPIGTRVVIHVPKNYNYELSGS